MNLLDPQPEAALPPADLAPAGLVPTGPAPDMPAPDQVATDLVVPDPAAPDLVAAVRLLSRASVLVVGDVMLDRFIYGQVTRISPEAPVPILSVQR
jgi:D-beta-D-heptose 7-phosphate kinase/D-beta-D-heptose 1-phosphate adenosyltransferase